MNSQTLCIIIFCPTLLFGGFWDWFYPNEKDERIDFYCSHHCGEWGSTSIQLLEWNFIQCLYNAHEKSKSIWTLSDVKTRQLLKKNAGKGQKVRGQPGLPGYKERVNCGEIIGKYFNEETKEILPTTMAIIHYSKKGAHFVPAAPKKW